MGPEGAYLTGANNAVRSRPATGRVIGRDITRGSRLVRIEVDYNVALLWKRLLARLSSAGVVESQSGNSCVKRLIDWLW